MDFLNDESVNCKGGCGECSKCRESVVDNSELERAKLHEECGVFGIYSYDREIAVSPCVYHGLVALQHRGQESCGIAVSDRGKFSHYKDMGLVSEVFNKQKLDELVGQIAIGHVRYSTAGGSVAENCQPLVMRYVKGTLGFAHNGNLTNAYELRKELEERGAIFQTTIDSEVIAYLVARERPHTHKVELAVRQAMKQLHGAYSLLVMSPRKLIAARDPKGFRPLCMGHIGNDIVFASETCALDAVGAKFMRDVDPGEIITCDEDGIHSDRSLCKSDIAHCVFEYIYFARTDSVIDGVSVYESRRQAGRQLAKQKPVKADIVIGVPESGIDAAIGYAEESGIPYAKGIVKNSYIGRTFIKPDQSQRTNAVRLKLNALESIVKGRRVVMLDDSIVRGTTMHRIVNMLREAGASEVHVRISSPAFRNPCFYGVDIPSKDDLIANQHTVDEIAELIEADSLDFLDLDAIVKLTCGKKLPLCTACFDGRYPDGMTSHHMNKDDEIL